MNSDLQHQAEELARLLCKKGIITSPAMFAGMLMRRGYIYTVDQRLLGSYKGTGPEWACHFVDGRGRFIYFSSDWFLGKPIKYIAAEFDRTIAEGQHHMACICGAPILYNGNEVYVGGYGTYNLHRIYRDAHAGSKSAILERCPACNVVLNSTTVVEIQDDV